MSVSPTKRREACLRLLRSDIDIDGTVEWMLKEWADEPTSQRATNKGKLCRNIITIGSTGDQQYLNLVSFQQALDIYNKELHSKDVERLEKDLAGAKEESRNYRELYDEKVGEVLDLNEKLRNSQDRMLALMDREGVAAA